jgi:DNA-binding beta-propeller fold protein YncE
MNRADAWMALVVATAVGCGAQPATPVATEPARAIVPDLPDAAPAGSKASSVLPEADAAAAGGDPAPRAHRSIALPGTQGPAFLDYIAYERANARVWVPVGSTGSVDVLDTASWEFTRIDGFQTSEVEAHGKKRTLGPSAAAVGDGVVYIGDRASSEICPVDVKTLKAAACIKLSSPTDGVAYVASAREVWVTTPRDRALTILDASTPRTLKPKAIVKTDGAPEGYAVDEKDGLFFTNLEDRGGTAVIDVKTHTLKSTWNAGCGADGPRGAAFDAVHSFLLVACTDHVQVLDASHDGAQLGKLETGAGLDNIDVVGAAVYAASGKAARLTVAKIDERGQLTVIARADTSEGARNAVADERGGVYVADSLGARILVFAP